MDSETGNIRYLPVGSDERSTQLSTSFAKPRNVEPAEFSRYVTPLLSLTAPTGMTQEERKTWMHAAFQALDDVSPAQLEWAVKQAMATADHPSKIVPAIRKALNDGSGYKSMVTINRPDPVLLLPRDDVQADAERAEVAKLVSGLAKKLSARDAQ